MLRTALLSGKSVFIPQLVPPAKDTTLEMSPLSARLGLMRMRRVSKVDEWLSWPVNKFGIIEPPVLNVELETDDALLAGEIYPSILVKFPLGDH